MFEIKIAKTCFPLFMKKVTFGIKITKCCFPLFVNKVNFGVNITKYQELGRSVNFFENITFWVRSVNFFESNILGVRSINFFETIISGVRSVFFSRISFWGQKCKLSFLRPHANFQFFSVNHVFECLIDGFRSWEGRNRHRMDLL